MLDSQAALWASTGRPEMSVFHTLSAGNIGQAGAPGTGVPADAAPVDTDRVSPTPATATAVAAVSLAIHECATSPTPGTTVAVVPSRATPPTEVPSVGVDASGRSPGSEPGDPTPVQVD